MFFVKFVDPVHHSSHTYGPFTTVACIRDPGVRGGLLLNAIDPQGVRNALATKKPTEIAWKVIFEPVRGLFDALVLPAGDDFVA